MKNLLKKQYSISSLNIILCSLILLLTNYKLFTQDCAFTISDYSFLVIGNSAAAVCFLFFNKIYQGIDSYLHENKVDKNQILEVELLIYKNKVLEHELNQSKLFIENIYNQSYIVENNESELIVSLQTLKSSLEKVAKEEEKRSWLNNGMVKFAEILRSNQNNIDQLANVITSELAKYMNINQIGLFIYDKENDEIEMVGCYAYDRKKYLKKKLSVGEGLVGQAILEKDIVFLTEVPDNYTFIKSGLGGSTPKCILIVPLVYNDVTIGAIEMASFKVLEDYEIDFVKKLSESIASSISTSIVATNTNKLLQDMQMKNEQMKAQEEELRQNMEELHSTQEEMARKEMHIKNLLENSQYNEVILKEKVEEIEILKIEEKQKLQNIIDKIEEQKKVMLQVIEQLPEKIFLKDENARLLLLNSALASGYNKKVEELIGTNDFDHFDHELATQFRAIELDIIKKNEPLTMYEDFPDANGEIRKLYTVKMPFKFPNSEKVGILGYQVDVTELKNAEKQLKATEERMNRKELELKQELKRKQEVIEKQMRKITELQAHHN